MAAQMGRADIMNDGAENPLDGNLFGKSRASRFFSQQMPILCTSQTRAAQHWTGPSTSKHPAVEAVERVGA